jgi:D-serine deaminase-like pyridoxal phosphate-dependent protein
MMIASRKNVSTGTNYLELDTPSLLLDLDALENNISRMASFFDTVPSSLRPHSKTHKCPTIAHKQIAAGAIGICCQKLGEAEVMAHHGVEDILITNQIVGVAKIKRLVDLLAIANDVKIAVDNQENVEELASATEAARVHLGVLIEIEIGMGRCGILPGEGAIELAKLIHRSPYLELKGLMGYEGHCVTVPNFEDRERMTLEAISKLLEIKHDIESEGIKVDILSAGGTGTYNITGRQEGITEIEAGSYVFMDTTYRKVLKDFDHSLSVLATVISKPEEDRIVLDCGVKTLVGDLGTPAIQGIRPAHKYRLSEEHSIWSYEGSMDDLSLGDKVRVLPGHCCSTANMHDHYYVLQDDHVVDVWEISAARKAK